MPLSVTGITGEDGTGGGQGGPPTKLMAMRREIDFYGQDSASDSDSDSDMERGDSSGDDIRASSTSDGGNREDRNEDEIPAGEGAAAPSSVSEPLSVVSKEDVQKKVDPAAVASTVEDTAPVATAPAVEDCDGEMIVGSEGMECRESATAPSPDSTQPDAGTEPAAPHSKGVGIVHTSKPVNEPLSVVSKEDMKKNVDPKEGSASEFDLNGECKKPRMYSPRVYVPRPMCDWDGSAWWW